MTRLPSRCSPKRKTRLPENGDSIMNKLQKAAKRVADQQIKKRHYERDAENRVVINMTVKDDSNFLSVFSEGETPVISTEVAEFIEHSTHAVPPTELFTLRIRSSCIDDQEKSLYQKAIKEFYTQKYIANERELKRNLVIISLLSLMGILVLAFELFFEYKIGDAIWTEVIDIVAWVLLWESVDIGIFGNRSLKLKKKYYLSYLSMKVEFIGS